MQRYLWHPVASCKQLCVFARHATFLYSMIAHLTAQADILKPHSVILTDALNVHDTGDAVIGSMQS